jgi:hypothetical protein
MPLTLCCTRHSRTCGRVRRVIGALRYCTQQSEETWNDASNRSRSWGRGLVKSHKSVQKGPSERLFFHEKTLLAQKEASPERGFRVLQTAEIHCRKDDPVVLTSTVTQCLDDVYDLLIGSQLLVLVCNKRGVREPMFIPRNASEMTIVSSPSSRMGMLEQFYVQYKVTGGDGVESFVTYFQEVSTLMVLAEYTTIALTVPYFCLFLTGDLSFYADSLGKSKSCSYWCMYCTLHVPPPLVAWSYGNDQYWS